MAFDLTSAQQMGDRSPENQDALRAAIAKETDPENLKVLLAENDRLGGKATPKPMPRGRGGFDLASAKPAVPAATPAPTVEDIRGTPEGYAGRVAAIPGSSSAWQSGETSQQNQPEPGFLDKVKAALQAASNTVDSLVGGTIGAPVGMVRGLAGAVRSGQFGTPAGANAVEQATTQGMQQGTNLVQNVFGGGQTSPLGQEYTENVGQAMQAALPVAGVAHTLPPANLGPAARALGDVGRRAGTTAAESVVPSIAPQRAANVKAGMDQGLTYAPHQLADNKLVKMAGETAESVPGAGGATRRADRQQQFNQALIKHVNPESEATQLNGDVLGEAMDRSGGKIGEITGKTDLPLEDVQSGFAAQRRAMERTTPDNRQVLGGYIDEFERLASENGGSIPGAAFKDLNGELGRDIRANAGNPLGSKLSDLQDVVLDAFRNRLAPADRAAYDTSRTEYAKAKTILPLVAKSVEGDISPGALLNAVTASKAGKNAMGTGHGGALGDLAKAGKYLVDQKSSGTAERSLVQQLILDPIKGAAKVAVAYPAAAAYNLAGPAVARAMVRKGLRGAAPATEAAAPVAETAAPVADIVTRQQALDAAIRRNDAAEQTRLLGMNDAEWQASQAKPETIPTGQATELATPPAPTDPRIAEIEQLKAGTQSKAARAVLDEHAKAIQKEIDTKADADALQATAKATADPELRAKLLAKAEKLQPSIPTGKTVEGQPELPAAKAEKIPVGQATEITPEAITPEEVIPAGEANSLPSNRPAAEMVSNRPVAEPVSNMPIGEKPAPASNVPQAEADAYTHRALFDEAAKRGIEVRGRRPSEVRTAFEADWRREHGLGAQDAERAKIVAQALEINEKAVEQAALQHERSPAAFDKAIGQILEQGNKNANEAKQIAGGGASNSPNSAGAQAGPAAGRGGSANDGAGGASGNQSNPNTGGATGSVEAAAEQSGANGPSATGANAEAGVARGQAQANTGSTGKSGIVVKETPTGFEAYKNGEKVGSLKSNLTPEQSKSLNENASVDMVKVEKAEQGKREVGPALYEAWTKAHEGRTEISGKTEPNALKLWKRMYPEKVDAFVAQEAARIRSGSDPRLVLGNIKDPEIAQRVQQAAHEPRGFERGARRKGT